MFHYTSNDPKGQERKKFDKLQRVKTHVGIHAKVLSQDDRSGFVKANKSATAMSRESME